jgi:hypothetical protein
MLWPLTNSAATAGMSAVDSTLSGCLYRRPRGRNPGSLDSCSVGVLRRGRQAVAAGQIIRRGCPGSGLGTQQAHPSPSRTENGKRGVRRRRAGPVVRGQERQIVQQSWSTVGRTSLVVRDRGRWDNSLPTQKTHGRSPRNERSKVHVATIVLSLLLAGAFLGSGALKVVVAKQSLKMRRPADSITGFR